MIYLFFCLSQPAGWSIFSPDGEGFVCSLRGRPADTTRVWKQFQYLLCISDKKKKKLNVFIYLIIIENTVDTEKDIDL